MINIYPIKAEERKGEVVCHPFVVLRSSVQNSERGKKIGNAMMTTSRSVVQTGKVVGERALK